MTTIGEERLRLLARASALIASSLDDRAVLESLTRLVVPVEADWCAVDLVVGDDLERVAVTHADPEKVELAFEAVRRWPVQLSRQEGIPRVIRTGEPLLVPEIDDSVLQAAARDPEHLAVMRKLGLRSLISLPLRVLDRVVGVLTLVRDGDRRFGDSDLEVAVEIARRASTAVQVAQLVREARDAEERATRARREAESALAQVDALFSSSPLGLGLLDRDLRFLRINDALASFHGPASTEGLGLTPAQLMPDLGARSEEVLRNVLESGEVMTVERTAVRPASPDDPRRVIATYFPVRNREGAVLGLAVQVLDVTERRKLERARASHVRRQSALAEAALAMSSARDLDEALRVITKAARDAAGARTARTVVDPAVRGDRAEPAAGEHPDERVESGTLAVPLTARDGEHLGYIELGVRQDGELDGDGREALVQLARMASLTVETHVLLAALRAERDRTREASRVKDQFLAMLGHELRNPLAPMRTALDIMELDGTGAFAAERQVLERQVEHMTRLVDDLLDVSRISRGTLRLDKRSVDLASVVDRAIEMASPLLEARRHRLSSDVPEGLLVEGDAHRLAQVMSNLLTNAAKYTDPGGHVDVRARRDGDVIRLSVCDDGVAPEVLPGLFEAFTQGAQSLDRRQGGLGLGLTIVRNLVEMHGGAVSMSSEGPGMGTEVRVTLPVLTPEQPSAAPEVRDTPRGGGAATRVLVVDDNEDAAAMMAAILEARGYSITVALDGPNALAAARREPPHIALLDIGLPVMDGVELGRRLRQEHRATPPLLVAVTGYGQQEDRLRTRDAGFAHHLVKPVDVARLLGILEQSRHATAE